MLVPLLTIIGGKVLIYKHLPPILLIISVFLIFLYRCLGGG